MDELITTATLINKLPLVKENILQEAAEQPLLFMDAARLRVARMQKRSQAMLELDTYRAKLALHFRAVKDSEGKKITEGMLAQKVEINKKTKTLRQQFETAVQQEELSKLLLEAFRQRRDAIRIIAEAETFEGASEGQEAEKIMHKKMVKKAHEIAKLHAQEKEE